MDGEFARPAGGEAWISVVQRQLAHDILSSQYGQIYALQPHTAQRPRNQSPNRVIRVI